MKQVGRPEAPSGTWEGKLKAQVVYAKMGGERRKKERRKEG